MEEIDVTGNTTKQGSDNAMDTSNTIDFVKSINNNDDVANDDGAANDATGISISNSATSNKKMRTSSNTGSRSNTSKTSLSVHKNSSERSGKSILEKSLRSVLSHPLSFQLMCYMYRDRDRDRDKNKQQTSDPPFLPFTFSDSIKGLIANVKDKFDSILQDAWNESYNKVSQKVMEVDLTTSIVKQINNSGSIVIFRAEKETNVKTNEADGRIDMLFVDDNSDHKDSNFTTIPSMILEFGMVQKEWWNKFDQCLQYVEMIYQKNNTKSDQPILMVVITVDPSISSIDATKDSTSTTGPNVNIKMGLFCCRPRWSTDEKDFRISLLWNWNADTLEDGSRHFGKILEVAAMFHSMKSDQEDLYSNYEYFSSNCCKVDDKVYRIYDNRYRETHRSYDAYIDEALRDIVGECTVVLNISNQALPRMEEKEDGKNKLTIITTPYRLGSHTCTIPTAFLPIIDHLIALHKKNYIHGDIRAFNMVFGHDHTQGWLIDFDFAGLCGIAKLPPNYCKDLGDGSRLGEPGNMITKYHDWYALFSVIFTVHTLDYNYDNLSGNLASRLLNMQNFFKKTKTSDDISQDVIIQLKKLLRDYEHAGGCFVPGERFSESLEQCIGNTLITNHEGTGSPTIK